MPRIILDYPDSVEPVAAVEMLLQVVQNGKCSVAAGMPHYCWCSTFLDGCKAITRRKKAGQTSDSILILEPTIE